MGDGSSPYARQSEGAWRRQLSHTYIPFTERLKKMNIVILDGYTENPGDLSWSGMEALGRLDIYPRSAPSEIVCRIGDADAVIVNKTPIVRETMDQCPNLKYIGVLATGYNVVDVEAAREKGIVVTNIPTYGTAAVAQFVFALLLEICHHAAEHSQAVKQGEWARCPDWCFWNYPLIELAGKTMGIIGFGRIGQATARIAQALGMKILAHDAYADGTLESETLSYASLEEVLTNSDVISLHCPLLPATKGLINKKSIAQMKDGAILINTSRGPLVAEEDLAEALNTGKLYAAAVDVVSTEPIQPGNPLLRCPNCIITPHIAWAPKESRARLMEIAVDNLKAFIGGRPINIVNG